MTNLVHLLSVASLLLAAFLVGAIIGTLARIVALRLGRRPVATGVAPAEAAPSSPPLVAAPVIAPLPVTPTPQPPPPAEVPVPDFAETLIALEAAPPPDPAASTAPAVGPAPSQGRDASLAMQPAHVAGETTSGLLVAPPLSEAPAPAVATKPEPSEPHTADVIIFPSAKAEPAAERPADVIVGGEPVAVVDTIDLLAAGPGATPSVPEAGAAIEVGDQDNFVFVGMPVAPKVESTPVAADGRAETIPNPVIAANAPVGASVAAEPPVPEARPTEATSPVEAVNEEVATPTASAPEIQPAPVATDALQAAAIEPVRDAPEPTPVEELSQEPAAATQPQSTPQPDAAVPQEQSASEPEAGVVSLDEQLDEDAAMRAIEGNWSPRHVTPRRPLRPVPEPEGANQAVAASARAVIAARRTAEAIVAEVAEVKVEAGRPIGLDAPRDGRKDDLTHIIGVLPVIETALNQLGIYHFDQMGALTDENTAWIEGHLGIPGRIGRELWREQARELSAVLKPRRAAEH